MKWIDATLPLAAETVHWPGHPQYSVTNIMSMNDGDVMNVTAISLCSHFGTHIDAPSHYISDGKSVDELPLDLLVGPCRVLLYEGDDHIDDDFINGLDLQGVKRLCIRTINSEYLKQSEFRENYLALLPSAADALVNAGVQLLGVDGFSIGPFEPDIGVPVHQIFLSGSPDQAAIEAVDLSEIEPGDYHINALPMKLSGLEASPVRVLFGSD